MRFASHIACSPCPVWRCCAWSLLATFISFAFAASPILGDDRDPPKLPPASKRKIDFVKDVQPLLKRSCYSCHGPEEQEGGLRLDQRKRGLEGGDNGKAIVVRESHLSPLILRVAGTDPDLDRMPPEGAPLDANEIGVLRAWIDQGAVWPADADAGLAFSHWSFEPIQRPEPPPVKNAAWVRNPIDAFVLARLEADGIAPSPEAPAATRLRRLYLDLLGLTPPPEVAKAFLADPSDEAYDALVEQVLASKHYGERWGRHWLDLARYADSDGYEKDRPRPHAWRYREWVIRALNQDMPFDEFTIKQIAGDMLPDATVEDRVATGFHRNTLHNTEGGTDKEEDRVKKTVDRTNTMGTIWLGLTVGCAQCHSHKYDPITQREYYSLFGFFNSIDEKDIAAPLPAEQAAYQQAKAKHDAERQALAKSVDDYRKTNLLKAAEAWAAKTTLPSVVWRTWTPGNATSKHGAKLAPQKDGSYLASGENKLSDVYTLSGPSELKRITAIRVEVLPDKSLVKSGPGRANNGNFVLTTFSARWRTAGDGQPWKFSRAAADFSQSQWSPDLAINDSPEDGWAVSPEFGKRHAAMFVVDQSVEAGENETLEVVLDQTYNQSTPHNIGRFRISLTDSDAPELEGTDPQLAAALAKPRGEWTPEDRKVVVAHYAKTDAKYQELTATLTAHDKKAPPAPKTMAQTTMETGSPRTTRLHIRGDFLNPGDTVPVSTPSVLPPIQPAAKEAPNRLDLAHWIVAQDNPLMARVTVNRIWQRYFGIGLVATTDDFGSQGEKPSHPQLLDWLASEFRDNGWRLKDVHRRIVTSSVYRQASTTRTDLVDADPQNRLLARQTRRRVEAEIVRDLALAASGLLDPRVGGPSVRPPQPAEYAKLTYANSARWQTSTGGDQYRRGLYTFFQRTSPYPMLMTFDAPDSNACTAQRNASNTPLQALTLWNDPAFFECAQMLGRRLIEEAAGDGATAAIRDARIERAFLICLARRPRDSELATLRSVADKQRALLQANPEMAGKIAGGKPIPEGSNAEDVAVWTIVGRVLLNVDEFVSKE